MNWRTGKAFIITLLTAILMTPGAFAQEQSMDSKMNDFLRSSDKLYVVISILVTIFTGIVVYLFYQDNKIKKLPVPSNDPLFGKSIGLSKIWRAARQKERGKKSD